MSYQTILFEVSNGVARLTLNRPDRLNSFNVQMHGEVRDALSQLKSNSEARVLVFTGAGRGFCAGQDLISVIPSRITTSRWCWRYATCPCRSSAPSTASLRAQVQTSLWLAT
jgi:enoyl-CoA hydratase/carnithine racemase